MGTHQETTKRWLWLSSFVRLLAAWGGFLAVACDPLPKKVEFAELRVVGSPGATVRVFRLRGGVRQLTSEEMIPLGSVQAGKKYAFPTGHYYAVNECSAMFFHLEKSDERTLFLHRVRLEPDSGVKFSTLDEFDPESSEGEREFWRPSSPVGAEAKKVASEAEENEQAVVLSYFGEVVQGREQVIPASCNHPLSGERQEWTRRSEFEVLPGQVTLSIGGRDVLTDFLENKRAEHAVSLVPVIVKAKEKPARTRFFTEPADQKGLSQAEVVSAPVGSVLWLISGKYVLEINGTRRQVEMKKGQGLGVSLGILQIQLPQDFPMQERIRLGGQPIFAYINDGVLFSLNSEYLVFPGIYDVSLGGSDVRANHSVFSGKKTLVKTRGAVIRTPPCKEEESCKSPPRLTIHQEQRPFVLLHVETGVPFLVLDDTYEYGIEGIRGVLKTLRSSEKKAAEETLARLRLKWQVKKGASKVRTDLVRLETLNPERLYGRSLDFLFSKPTEVYVPPGSYELTYFVGEPSLERKKTKRPVYLGPGRTVSMVVPLYSDKVTRSALQQKNEESSSAPKKNRKRKLPTQLQPLQSP